MRPAAASRRRSEAKANVANQSSSMARGTSLAPIRSSCFLCHGPDICKNHAAMPSTEPANGMRLDLRC